jgi:hypothetical protein
MFGRSGVWSLELTVRVCSCLCCVTHTDSPFRPYGLSVVATVRSVHRVFQRVLHLIASDLVLRWRCLTDDPCSSDSPYRFGSFWRFCLQLRRLCLCLTDDPLEGMDGPRPPHRQSILASQIWLSASSLELCFCVASSLYLFLRSVGPLWLRDLGKFMWESLIVILGLSWFLFGEIFIGSHSLPLSGWLIGPSIYKHTMLKFGLICMHGDPIHQNTPSIWANVQDSVNQHPALPLICICVLNNIMSPNEKQGPRPGHLSHTSNFCCMVKECGFLYLGYNGSAYT